jgi:hypothetical protein
MIIWLCIHYGGYHWIKKIVLVIFIIIALFGGIILFDYYSLPPYTLDTGNGTLVKGRITYKHSNELLTK